MEFGQETKEKRPKRGKTVRFRMFEEEKFREGIIKQVGKPSGKDKNTCWVLETGEKESRAIDFRKEVDTWNYKVFFAESHNQDNSKDTLNDKHLEAKGVLFMKMKEPVEVLATAVKPSEYNHPEVLEAMDQELEKWIRYEAYTVVSIESIPKDVEIIDTTWNINMKEKHDGLKVDIKARLCIRGYKEDICPRKDSPTASRDSNINYLCHSSK